LVGPEGEWEDLFSFKGKKVLALSGIADPSSFFSLLIKCGMEIVKKATFPDHHFYTRKDLSFIEKERKGTDWVVTTEKDMVKLKSLNIGRLPFRALRVAIKIWEEEEFYKKVREVF
jgi:tetraacyldisaccharide 4'-kinase